MTLLFCYTSFIFDKTISDVISRFSFLNPDSSKSPVKPNAFCSESNFKSICDISFICLVLLYFKIKFHLQHHLLPVTILSIYPVIVSYPADTVYTVMHKY